MLVPTPPMSNAERQRRFQAAHPGYDSRRKARERASAKRGAAQILEALRTMSVEQVPAQRLALPAPVVDPLLAELDALSAALASARAREALPVRQSASAAPAKSRAA
jgi:hypothetical protein